MIPYDRIDTVCLDVGNTLISIDFEWVAEELDRRGMSCTPAQLRRAEAAARPAFSNRLFVDGLEEGADLFGLFLNALLAGLEGAASLTGDGLRALVAELRPVLRPDGRASTLWRSVMPRVPEALARLDEMGLTLAVVSNSDGTVEQSLAEAGLRTRMAAVIDSRVVGVEKPDPRIFRAALAACGAVAERTIHVGDLYHADVVGARAAGLHAVLLDPFDDWPIEDCERAPDLWTVAERIAAARGQPAV